VSFCQTVLPGNEAMLIPTEIQAGSSASLANPDTSYWCKTAAHYYINPPGMPASEACVWGSNAKDCGNWAPYVAGANVVDNGETFIKLGWNPIYLEPTTPFRNNMPDWGVRIECPDGKCNGLPCEISPTDNWVNQMKGSKATVGAGGGAFCVVTVPKGSTANFVVYGGSASGGGGPPHGPSGGPGGPPFGGQNSWSDAAMSSTTAAASSTTTAAWSSSTSTWAASNSTTTSYGPHPSDKPHDNLFGPASSSKPPITLASPTEKPGYTAAVPTIKPAATGAASRQQWSIAGLVVAMLAAAVLL
jgi:hypothetical protein